MAQGVRITVKGTMMIGQVMGLTLPLTTNPLVTPPPAPQSRLESEKETGPSGTGTTATAGSDLQPASWLSPCFLCCLCLSWPLLPPCGDSWLLQSGGGGFLSCWSFKHITKKVIPFGCTSRKKNTKQANFSNNQKPVYSTK